MVVDRTPQEDGEGQVQSEHQRQRRQVNESEGGQEHGQRQPQDRPQSQREIETVEDQEHRQQPGKGNSRLRPVSSVGQVRDAEQGKNADDEHRRERLPLVQHVPQTRRHQFETRGGPGAMRVPADSAQRVQFRQFADSGQGEGQGHRVRVSELQAMGGNRQCHPLLPRDPVGVEGAGHHGLVDPDASGRHMEHLEQDGERGDSHGCSDGQLNPESLCRNEDDGGLQHPAWQRPERGESNATAGNLPELVAQQFQPGPQEFRQHPEASGLARGQQDGPASQNHHSRECEPFQPELRPRCEGDGCPDNGSDCQQRSEVEVPRYGRCAEGFHDRHPIASSQYRSNNFAQLYRSQMIDKKSGLNRHDKLIYAYTTR